MRSTRHRSRSLAALFSAVLTGTGLVALASPAQADGPGVGTPWVVSVGDSYISGEAGRWAGNTNDDSWRVDALGSTAYYDNATKTAETIPGCHRASSAEIHIGGGVMSKNLACSGAETSTDASGSDFKPGLDFYTDSSGRKGQARELEDFARTNNVEMVVVSIGGNDFNFASIVQTCVENFLLSPSWWPDYCYDDSSVSSNFSSANVAAVTADITTSLQNVQTAMTNAGYSSSDYTVLVQTYVSPIPRGSGFRYSQSGYTRQSTGGCGFWNKDADWANDVALAKINGAVRQAVTNSGLGNAEILELSSAYNGKRLCENTVGLLEEEGLSSWQSAGAVDNSEWISQIRTVSTVFGPYQVQESLHPNYWGQMAVRSCVRQAYNGGYPHGGTCVQDGTGLTWRGEPRMALR